MNLLECLTDNAKDELIKEILSASYHNIISNIYENNFHESYVPIYSYERDDESEHLAKLKEHFEAMLEWYVGYNWREKCGIN